MDMKRLNFIEKIHNQAPPGTEWGVNAYQVTELIQTIKQQQEQIERYEEALNFYANRQAYYQLTDAQSEVMEDYGHRARQALGES